MGVNRECLTSITAHSSLEYLTQVNERKAYNPTCADNRRRDMALQYHSGNKRPLKICECSRDKERVRAHLFRCASQSRSANGRRTFLLLRLVLVSRVDLSVSSRGLLAGSQPLRSGTVSYGTLPAG